VLEGIIILLGFVFTTFVSQFSSKGTNSLKEVNTLNGGTLTPEKYLRFITQGETIPSVEILHKVDSLTLSDVKTFEGLRSK